MNFHKTIGFLATLLLTLGLGVPDSFAQAPKAVNKIALSLNKDTFADDAGATGVILTAMVTLKANAAAGGQTVTVTLVDSTATSVAANMQAEGTDYTLTPTGLLTQTIEVTIPGGSKTGSADKAFTIDPNTDSEGETSPDTADEMIAIGGWTPADQAVAGDPAATDNVAAPVAKITITDTDNGVTDVALSLNKDTFADTDDATGVILTAMVTLERAAAAATTVTVTLVDSTETSVAPNMRAEGDGGTGDDYAFDPNITTSPNNTILVPIAKDSNTGSADKVFTIDPNIDADDTADEMIAIGGATEVIGTTTTDVAKITITDTDNGVTDVALSLNKDTFADTDDDTGVILTAMVTLERAAAAATTVTVTLVDSTATSVAENMRAESTDYALTPSGLLDGSNTILVPIAKGSNTGSADRLFNINPDTDGDGDTGTDTDDEMIAIGGVAETETGVTKITITDTDNGVTDVALSLDKDTFADDDGATGVILTAMVTLERVAAAATTVTVTLVDSTTTSVKPANMRAEWDGTVNDATQDYTLSPNITTSPDNTILVPIAKDSNTGSADKVFTIDPNIDADTDDEMAAIGGAVVSIGTTTTGFVKFSITDAEKARPGAVASVELSAATLSVDEGATLATTVTVTVNVAEGAATSHDVVLSVDSGTLADLGITSSTVSVPIAADETSGMAEVALEYMAPEDDDNTTDEMIVITGMVSGQSDAVTVTVVDNDMGAVASVELSSAMLSVDEGATLATTVTVTVNVEAGAATDYNVVLSSDTPLPLGTINSPVAVSVGQGETSGMAEVALTYTAPEDDNSADEMIVITGMVGGQSDAVTVTVADNDEGAVASVELSPATLSVDEGATLATTVTVTVNVEAGATAAHNVILSVDSGTLADLDITSSTVTLVIPHGMTSEMAEIPITYSAPTDADLNDEMIVITGMVGGQSDMVTITVADQTEAEGTIKVSTNLESIRENSRTRNVVVTAELDAAPDDGTTVMVTVDVTGGETPVQVQIPIVGPAKSNTATVAITPVNDDVFTTKSFTVTGSVTGYRSGMAMIDIVDDDGSVGTISITSSPASATLNGGSQTLNLSVKAVLSDKEVEQGAVTVTLTTNKGTLSHSSVPLILRKNPDKVPSTVAAEGTSGARFGTIVGNPQTPNFNIKVKLTLTAAEAANSTAIEVTGTADQYVTGSRTIEVRTRRAFDVAGYRAVIVKPTGTNWAPVGNDQVIVDVTRYGDVAYPWSNFESIKVSVRDTAHADFELEQVTARGFNREGDGSVTFNEPASHARVKVTYEDDKITVKNSETPMSSRGDVIWRGNDTIRFEIRINSHIGPHDVSDSATDRRSGTYNGTNADPAENGQYLGAYAHVEFFDTALDGTIKSAGAIETRDDETSVYPSDPALVNNAKVGDGRLLRVDNDIPDHSGVGAVRVTSRDGDEVGGAIDATVGDEIRVAVAVSQTNLFRGGGMRIQLQIVDGTGTVRGQKLTTGQRNNPSKNKDFSSSQVINAANDSLIHTYTVTEGFFTVKLDDFVEGVGEKGNSLDLDNARARVRAGVKDQANNFTFSGWTTFDIDSRSPRVSILYPSADPDSLYDHTHSMHFSGDTESVVEGQNVDAHLNPLRISFDEALSELKVYAVGADTLSTEEGSGQSALPALFQLCRG